MSNFEAYLKRRIAEEQDAAHKENAFSGKHRLQVELLRDVLANYEESVAKYCCDSSRRPDGYCCEYMAAYESSQDYLYGARKA